MPQQALPRFLIIAGHAIGPDVLPQRPRRSVRLRLLQQALCHVHHLVAAGLVKAHRSVGGDGILALVPVAQVLSVGENTLHRHVAAADAPQRVLHPLALGRQFLLPVHVPEVAAAAPPVIRTVRRCAVGRRFTKRTELAEGGVFQHLQHQHVALFAL